MKPRKKYNPRKHRTYSNTGIPMHILVKAATSKQPVSGEEVESITAPYADAVEAIRSGTCTDSQFWHLLENHYLYIHLLRVLRGLDKYSDNPETDMLARLEIQIACDDALNKTTEIIESIGERKKQRGHFIATGTELTQLIQSCEKFRAILGIANYSHYMQAYKNSEPVISDIEYKHNKRIKRSR